jgi:hypothetical protein
LPRSVSSARWYPSRFRLSPGLWNGAELVFQLSIRCWRFSGCRHSWGVSTRSSSNRSGNMQMYCASRGRIDKFCPFPNCQTEWTNPRWM